MLIFILSLILVMTVNAWDQNVTSIDSYPEPKPVAVAKVAAQISRVDHNLLREDYLFMNE